MTVKVFKEFTDHKRLRTKLCWFVLCQVVCSWDAIEFALVHKWTIDAVDAVDAVDPRKKLKAQSRPGYVGECRVTQSSAKPLRGCWPWPGSARGSRVGRMVLRMPIQWTDGCLQRCGWSKGPKLGSLKSLLFLMTVSKLHFFWNKVNENIGESCLWFCVEIQRGQGCTLLCRWWADAKVKIGLALHVCEELWHSTCNHQRHLSEFAEHKLDPKKWKWFGNTGGITKSQAHPGKAAKEEVAPSHLSTDLKQAENWEHGNPCDFRVRLFLFPAATLILKFKASFIQVRDFGILRCWATYQPVQTIFISRHWGR